MTKRIIKLISLLVITTLIFTLVPLKNVIAQTSSSDEEAAVKAPIEEYFRLKYEARSGMSPSAFGHLVANNAQAQKFLRDEMDRREIEYHRAQLFGLGYVDYSYTLDFQNIEIDQSSGTAIVTLFEGHDVVFEVSAPTISQMRDLRHIITLLETNEGWKIVEDQYEDLLVQLLNSGVSKAEAIQLNIQNYQEMIEQLHGAKPENIGTVPSLSTYSYNRSLAVQYAHDHWQYGGTSPYVDFNQLGWSDCANFVSQAMYAGGISEIQGADRTGWYWNAYANADYAVAWAGAHYLRDFMLYQHSWNGGPEAIAVDSSIAVSGGDVIAYELSGLTAYWDHVVMVVYVGFPTLVATRSAGGDGNHDYYPYYSWTYRDIEFMAIIPD